MSAIRRAVAALFGVGEHLARIALKPLRILGGSAPGRREPEKQAPDEPPPMTGTVVRGAGYAAVGYVLAQGLTLGFYLALARLATPEDFGEFAAASIVIATGLLFTESGMLAALIHRRDRIEEAASTAVFSTAIGGLLFGLIALGLSPLIGAFFESERIGELAAAMSGLLLVRSLQVVPEALMQRRFSFLRRMVVEPVQVTAFGVTAVIATSNDLGPWGLVLGYYASAVTDVVLSWILVRWKPKPSLASYATWRELIGYGRHVLASNIVLRVSEQVPTALLGRFVSQGALGQFRYANRMSMTPFALVLSAASYVVFPAFARISHDTARFSAAFVSSLRWFTALAAPLGMMLLPLGVPLAVVLFGDVWRDAGEAAMALSVYTVGASLISIVSEGLKAEGRPELLIRIHTVTGTAATASMAALLPFGLVGVAAGVSVGAAIGAAYALVSFASVLAIPMRAISATIWPPLLASAAMAGALFGVGALVDPQSFATPAAIALLAGEAVAGLGLYAAVLALVAPGTLRRGREMIASARERGVSRVAES